MPAQSAQGKGEARGRQVAPGARPAKELPGAGEGRSLKGEDYMLKKIIGGVVGAKLAKRSPKISGTTGAALGAAVPLVLARASLPAMVALGVGGYFAKRWYDKKAPAAPTPAPHGLRGVTGRARSAPRPAAPPPGAAASAARGRPAPARRPAAPGRRPRSAAAASGRRRGRRGGRGLLAEDGVLDLAENRHSASSYIVRVRNCAGSTSVNRRDGLSLLTSTIRDRRIFLRRAGRMSHFDIGPLTDPCVSCLQWDATGSHGGEPWIWSVLK